MRAALFNKLRNLSRQPAFVWLWLIPVWLLLGVCRLVILLVPFRVIAARLGVRDGVAPWVPLLDAAQERHALLIGRVVRKAARYTPWASNCFPQAMVARILLGLYGIPYALYFGLTRDIDTREMKAHAWVASGRLQLTGGISFHEFTVVGCFVSALAKGDINSTEAL